MSIILLFRVRQAMQVMARRRNYLGYVAPGISNIDHLSTGLCESSAVSKFVSSTHLSYLSTPNALKSYWYENIRHVVWAIHYLLGDTSSPFEVGCIVLSIVLCTLAPLPGCRNAPILWMLFRSIKELWSALAFQISSVHQPGRNRNNLRWIFRFFMT